jgi:hypothetical protein
MISSARHGRVLGLVGRDGAAPHDLLRMVKQGRILAWAGEASTTPSPSGSPSSATSPRARNRARPANVPSTHTDRHRLEALRDYAQTPVTFTPLKSDALLRLPICDRVGEDVTRKSIIALRDDIVDVQHRLDDAQCRAHKLPHREKYLLLVTGFLRRLLELHLELIEDTEHELAPTTPKRAQQPA